MKKPYTWQIEGYDLQGNLLDIVQMDNITNMIYYNQSSFYEGKKDIKEYFNYKYPIVKERYLCRLIDKKIYLA